MWHCRSMLRPSAAGGGAGLAGAGARTRPTQCALAPAAATKLPDRSQRHAPLLRGQPLQTQACSRGGIALPLGARRRSAPTAPSRCRQQRGRAPLSVVAHGAKVPPVDLVASGGRALASVAAAIALSALISLLCRWLAPDGRPGGRWRRQRSSSSSKARGGGAAAAPRAGGEAGATSEDDEDAAAAAGLDPAAKEARRERAGIRRVLGTGFGVLALAAREPSRALVPVVFLAEAAKWLLAAGAVVTRRLGKRAEHIHVFQMCLNEVLMALHDLLCRCQELVMLAPLFIGVWFLLRLKEGAVAAVLHTDPRPPQFEPWREGGERGGPGSGAGDGVDAWEEDDDDDDDGDDDDPYSGDARLTSLRQLLVPLSTLLSWLIVAGGVFAGLRLVGIDLVPLLAVGGLSGVALGFAAQSLAQNAMSAMMLFLTRPFIQGERVLLKTANGATVANGWVQRITVMHTVIKDDSFQTLTIPNRVVADTVVTNESRLGPTPTQRQYALPRLLSLSLTLPLKDGSAARAAAAAAKVEEYLAGLAELDRRLPYGCTVSQLTDAGAKLAVLAHCRPRYAAPRQWGRFATRVSAGVSRVVRQALEEDGAAAAAGAQQQ